MTAIQVPSQDSTTPPTKVIAGEVLRQIGHNPNAPSVYSIASFSDVAEFSLSANPIDIDREFREGKRTSEAGMTPADKLLYTFANQFREDPIGGEDFITVRETDAEGPFFGSFHFMRLGGRGEQEFHYHPPGKINRKEYTDSSQRVVLVYPLQYNTPQGPDSIRAGDGITFEWFQDDNSKFVWPRGADYPHMEGEPVSPLYRAWIPPGHVAVVAFGAGVHHFKGTGLAISAHFLDVNSHDRGSYLGNTAGWQGKKPPPDEVENVSIIEIPAIKNGHLPKTAGADILRHMFNHHGRIIRERVEAHVKKNAGEPLDQHGLVQLVNDLR
ncbi:MAG: hypothetical protein DYH13_05715 [Alphaproteobacteria bacterium PRO2]|nr:hypothetical protein [Alphaproteobacteria bacterium PRO2]